MPSACKRFTRRHTPIAKARSIARRTPVARRFTPKQAHGPDKHRCNDLLARLTAHWQCNRAMVLDTPMLQTCTHLQRAVPTMGIVCPQMHPDEGAAMRRAIAKRAESGDSWSRVHVVDGTMAQALELHGAAFMSQPGCPMLWHDAMSCWSTTTTGTSVHADFRRVVDLFAASPAPRMLCAFTFSQHGDPACRDTYGTIAFVAWRDMQAHVNRTHGVQIWLVDDFRYNMCMTIFELTKETVEAHPVPCAFRWTKNDTVMIEGRVATVISIDRSRHCYNVRYTNGLLTECFDHQTTPLWREHDKVRVFWDKQAWKSQWYDGVIARINGRTCEVEYLDGHKRTAWTHKLVDVFPRPGN
jgi:hypothetical protein